MAATRWPAQETHRAQPSGREATWPRGRPCGAPRASSVIERIMTINRGIHSPIYTHHLLLFSPCGTMFPHGLTCAGRVATYRTSDAIGTAVIAWTRVHAITDQSTCVI